MGPGEARFERERSRNRMRRIESVDRYDGSDDFNSAASEFQTIV